MNLMRNLGGSVGISAVTTLIARRQQTHQVYLAQNTFESNPQLQRALTGITSHFTLRSGSADATRHAYGQIYATVQRQAAVLAYIDTFWIMGALCVLAIGLLFFAKKNKPGSAAMAH
uniref:Drug resistance transporter n=1 Tax=uncultured bacterium CSLG7 TaxID=1091577 RepID=G4WV50_9BACT|nr:drug resistance transporter [uncultured bacterium CSLG7]